jgi:hypothetical protein
MKTNFFILIFLSVSLIAQAQLEKGKIVLDISGNFSRTFSESGVTTNAFSSKTKELNTQFSLGYCLSNSIVAGIGFGYSYGKSSTVNEIIDYSVFNIIVNQTDETTKIPMLLGYLRYNKGVVNRLYIGVDFNFGYGWANSTTSYMYASSKAYSADSTRYIGDDNSSSDNGGDQKFDANILMAELSPRITYFTGNHFGIFLNLGGATATVQDGDFDTTQWIVNFDPRYWSLGFEVKFK